MHDGERSGDASNAAASPQSVCAIVITYHPPEEFPRIIERILPQVGAIVIVDNGSAGGTRDAARNRRGSGDTTDLQRRESRNRGGAEHRHSTSRGSRLRMGAADGSRQLREFRMVEALNSVRARFRTRPHLAVVGSGYDDEERGPPVPAEMQHDAAPWQDMESVITSGSLLSLAAYTAIGPFREDFFIDHVDTEYCLRARLKHYRVIKTRSPLDVACNRRADDASDPVDGEANDQSWAGSPLLLHAERHGFIA
jgi:rhamnosyltransferase